MRTALLALLPMVFGAPAVPVAAKSAARDTTKPVFWVIAGDSTTAPGGGWGDCFINDTARPSTGHNWGHNGTTTKSFRDLGDWAKVLSDIATYKKDYRVYVTIQFGHNDQKTTSGVSLDDYRTNLGTLSSEVLSAGGTPILVTSLTRRQFKNTTSSPRVNENLATQRNITIAVAQENKLHYVDLNEASTAYVNAIGPAASVVLNLDGTDTTHLSLEGQAVFGRMMADLVAEKYGAEFEGVFEKDEALSAVIDGGKAVETGLRCSA